MAKLDYLYFVALLLLLLHSILNTILRKDEFKKRLNIIIVPIEMVCFFFTIYYFIDSKKIEYQVNETKKYAIAQGNILNAALESAKEQKIRLDRTISDAKLQADSLTSLTERAKKQEYSMKVLIEDQRIIKSFVLTASLIFKSKVAVGKISNTMGKRGAAINSKIKGIEDIQLVSDWDMRYPDDNTVVFYYEYTPSEKHRLIGKPLKYLESFDKISIYYSYIFTRDMLFQEMHADLVPGFKITLKIFINGILYDESDYLLSDINPGGNTIQFWTKGGYFNNIEDKFLKKIRDQY